MFTFVEFNKSSTLNIIIMNQYLSLYQYLIDHALINLQNILDGNNTKYNTVEKINDYKLKFANYVGTTVDVLYKGGTVIFSDMDDKIAYLAYRIHCGDSGTRLHHRSSGLSCTFTIPAYDVDDLRQVVTDLDLK